MAEFYGWAAGVKKHDIYKIAGEKRAPIAFVHTMQDILDSPQYNDRNFLQTIDHPVAGEARYPGPPWWMGPDGWASERAPLLGEHTDEVLREVAGMSAEEISTATAEVPA
jgi:CoA:oxalate CoA-transferase